MKETTKTSRLAGYLEKIFRAINADSFAGQPAWEARFFYVRRFECCYSRFPASLRATTRARVFAASIQKGTEIGKSTLEESKEPCPKRTQQNNFFVCVGLLKQRKGRGLK